MICPLIPLTIPVWRMVHPSRHREPMSGEGARLYGGRWNMKGWPALYLATDHATAIAEFFQGMAKPGTLVPYRLAATAIADLTTESAADRVAAAIAEDWKTVAAIEGRVPLGWELSRLLIESGAQGAIVPSVQNRGGTNLVLWRWHDAARGPGPGPGPGEGAALTLVDPDAALARA